MIKLTYEVKPMKNFQSEDDYLERILILSQKGHVRSIDIALDMNFSKPSISVAMKKLREKGFITIDNNGYIYLTDEGNNKAQAVYEKHTVISSLFMKLGVSEKTALEDACKIEHYLSEETFIKLKEHLNNKST